MLLNWTGSRTERSRLPGFRARIPFISLSPLVSFILMTEYLQGQGAALRRPLTSKRDNIQIVKIKPGARYQVATVETYRANIHTERTFLITSLSILSALRRYRNFRLNFRCFACIFYVQSIFAVVVDLFRILNLNFKLRSFAGRNCTLRLLL